MEAISIYLVIILVIAGIVGTVVWVWWLQKRRREEWMAQALELDLHYERKIDQFDRRYSSFKLFNQGRRRLAKNVLSGQQRGGQITLADYQYTTGSGKNSHTYIQTVCILRSEKLNLPHCFVRRQNRVFDFLGKLFGGQDINFPEDPEFSKGFVLQGQNESATQEIFAAHVRQHFLKYQKTSFQFECLGDTLVVHHGRTIKPEKAREIIEQAMEFSTLFSRRK